MADDVASLRALAHPVRLQILSLLTGAELSAAEVARELGITQANASYHLRTLAAAGQVVVAGTETIRGGTAKRYRHPWDAATPLRPVEDDDFPLYLQALAAEMVRRGALRTPGRTSSTDADLWVEPEVWAEVMEQVDAAASRLHAAARPPRTDGTVRVNMTAALFAMRDVVPGEQA
ncbi:ArsR/SmtB family transcription factor [Solicola sp. PLA-1-18]|uniref:ArsR/SmtB family transcription factor n=1 Tax=Solicola sp. PLA-1-18 TaxID=3380532 RepID=UPI003B7C9076